MTEPNPDDVAAFLKSDAPPGSVSFQLDPEAAQSIVGDALPEVEEPKVRVEIPADTTFDPEGRTIQDVLFWTLEIPDIGKVEVTDPEKTLYLKALDNDDRYQLTVDLKTKNFSATLRSRTVFEQKVIFESIQRDVDANLIRDPSSYLIRAQQLSVAVMLVEINGRLYTKDASELQLPTTIGEAIPVLNAFADQHIGRFSDVRWGALVTALRIFEIKCKLCNDNVNNDTFWEPASSGSST